MNYFIANIILFLGCMFHPVHFAVTSLEINPGGLTTSIKLFKDDFRTILKKNYETELDIEKCFITKQDSNSILTYINTNFSIVFDDKKGLAFHQIDSIKCNELAIWVIFNKKDVPIFKQVKISNTLMLDLYDDQKNLVIYKNKDDEKGFEMNRTKTSIVFKK